MDEKIVAILAIMIIAIAALIISGNTTILIGAVGAIAGLAGWKNKA